MNFFENGCEIVTDFASPIWVSKILADIDRHEFTSASGGIRNINKKLNSVAEYLASDEFKEKSNNFLTSNFSLVRAILFNKTSNANWFVTWHQDRTVAVSSKFENPEWKVWSIKEDVLHVQPPLSVLERMVTIRLHLDAATKDNGCLKVIPDSHSLGIIPSSSVTDLVVGKEIIYCEAQTGASLIMRPLLIHASSKSENQNSRRVLHLEFSDYQLPQGIDWA